MSNPIQTFIPADWAKNLTRRFKLDFLHNIISQKNYFYDNIPQVEDFESRLKKITNRAEDNALRLAVIGGFSSGKSTLINALLYSRFLVRKNEATTATATYIRGGETLSVKIETTKGEIFEATEKNFKSIRKKLSQKININLNDTKDFRGFFAELTTEESISSKINRVEVSVPDKNFRIHDLEIIDTPGFNSGTARGARHKSVTENILKNYADGLIVLIPATMASAGKDLINFLQSNVPAYALEDAIFILSKADLIDEEEDPLDEIVESVALELKKHFKLNKIPKIFPINSENELPPKEEKVGFFSRIFGSKSPKTKKADPVWTKRFDKLLSFIQEYLKNNRTYLMENHLNELCKNLCSDLKNSLSVREKEICTQTKFIQDHTPKKIKTLTSQLLEEIYEQLVDFQENDIAKLSEHIKVEILQDWETLVENCNEAILFEVKNGNDSNSIERAILSELLNFQKKWEQVIAKRLKIFQNDIKAFHKKFILEFERHYEGFKGLSAKIQVEGLNVNKIDLPSCSASINFEDGTKTMIGAASAGALIGTFLFPGLGTILGGAIGGFLGKLFGEDSVEEIQEKIWNNIEDNISQWHDQLIENLGNHIELIPSYIYDKFKVLAEAHIQQYGEDVEKRIKENEEQLKSLKKLSSSMLNDINKLETIINNN